MRMARRTAVGFLRRTVLFLFGFYEDCVLPYLYYFFDGDEHLVLVGKFKTFTAGNGYSKPTVFGKTYR